MNIIESNMNEACLHPSHHKVGIKPFPGQLHVVTMMENPLRWTSRYRNYWSFQSHVERAGAILYTAEIAFGERQFEITSHDNPKHLQLRSSHELWHKENALNLLINRLPADAKYIAWIDADVKFVRPDWVQETLHQLQHYDVVQMFSHAQDVGPNHEPVKTTPGFIYKWLEDHPAPDNPSFGQEIPVHGDSSGGSSNNILTSHPGFAWAARRDALDKLGGLIDWAILGSADWHMAAALVGQVERSIYVNYSETYKRWTRQWAERADKYIRRNVGFVSGLVNHAWHGKKKDRNYDKRYKFLANAGYDPEIDIKRDCQGLWQLTDRSTILRDGIRKYARARNEDSYEA